MGWYDGYGMHWFAWLMMIVLMLVFWGGLIAVIVTASRRYWPPRPNRPASEDGARSQSPEPTRPRRADAEDILAARFARGEIDEQEYRARRDMLRD